MLWKRSRTKEPAFLQSDSVEALGKELLDLMRSRAGSVFTKEFWQNRALQWYLANEDLKIQMLRFVDVLPALKDPASVVQHLKEYFPRQDTRLPASLRAGIAVSGLGLSSVASGIAEFAVKTVARYFIAGSNIQEASEAIEKLAAAGALYTVDILGEAIRSEAEADAYAQAYLELVEGLAAERDRCGPVNVSIKPTALYSQFEPAAPKHSSAAVLERLLPIAHRVIELGGQATLDMEQYAFREITLQIFRDLFNDRLVRESGAVGIAFQTYLKDSRAKAEELLSFLRTLPQAPWVRLVKGAYWDWEIINAVYNGWPIPVFTAKENTDRVFEAIVEKFLKNNKVVRTAVASHNIRSLAVAAHAARKYKVPEDRWEFQVLYGMGAPVMDALLAAGFSVRVYVPYGPLIPGMAYLVRRILENTANESFLRRTFAESAPPEELLKAPAEAPERTVRIRLPVENHPPVDFSRPQNIEAMKEALSEVASRFPYTVPLVIGGREVKGESTFPSVRPDKPGVVVGTAQTGTPRHVREALRCAREAFPGWAAVSAEKRRDILLQAARIIDARRFELAALMVYEAGKTWREADGDVVEAIDCLRYYGSEAVRLSQAEDLCDIPGEINQYGYRPRGVGAIIAPWNFPLAIFAGMTAGAVAAGNTVVAKPASATPVVAWHFVSILHEAGLPPGVVNMVTGPGSTVGTELVRSPEVDFIAFTGSRAVGLQIARNAAETPGRNVKKLILEMGGKNAIIIDEDADLDEAVAGVVRSAFGYQGQKCSACSRVIVLPGVRENFVRRFVEATRSLRIGPPEDPSVSMGPLIDEKQLRTVRAYVEAGKKEAEVLLEVTDLPQEGYFHGPVVFGGVRPEAQIAQEEIFGPVVAVIEAPDLEEALQIMNGTPYALTGGIYSRSPGSIAKARKCAAVGNFYVNRPITGAVVGRQPFGGFRMSGVGSKAGGPDYVKQFMVPVTFTENTVRRGITEFTFQ